MDIVIANRKLARACNDLQTAVKRFGKIRGGLLQRRLAQMHAATNLGDLFLLPGARCHELTGDRAGQFAVDLEHPMRLIFEPADEPVPHKPDGGVDRSQVRKIRIRKMVDYHG